MLKIKKKSQMSIFVVISIILIIVTSFLFYNNKFDFFVSHESKIKSQVSDSIKDCVLKETKNGAFLLGFQGGRIEISREIKLDKLNFKHRYIDIGLNNSGFKIMNWDSDLGEIPTIDSMEKELQTFVRNNSISCIENNLKALKDTLNITIEDKLKIDIKLNKRNVAVDIKLPIKFNEINSQQTFYISDYFLKIDGLKIKDLYELSLRIYNLEKQSNFFEELVLEQIASASDYSSPNSMPSEGMNIACGFRPWTINQLKKNLANLNNHNFKYLQFVGTFSKNGILDANLNDNFKKYYQSPVIGYVQKIPNLKRNFKDFEVDVTMPSVEQTGKNGYFQKYPYRKFEVTPSSGNLVKPINMKIGKDVKIPIPCIQVFHHLYDLDYDLMIKIVDRSDDGMNYFFQFPLRILIEKSQPKKSEQSQRISIEKTTATNEKFCAKNNLKYPLYVYATDKSTGNLLDDVNISYECIQLSCDIGKTSKRVLDLGDGRKVVDQNSRPVLETKFPFCLGGRIIGEKKGYFRGIKKGVITDNSLLDTEDLDSGNGKNIKEVSLIPQLKFNINEGSFLLVEKSGISYRVRQLGGSVYVDIENKGIDFESQILWPIESSGYFDKVVLLDDEDVLYNISIIYLDSNSNLRGIAEIENWKPNLNSIRSGAKIKFIIPISPNIIDEKSYVDFTNYMNAGIESSLFGIKFS